PPNCRYFDDVGLRAVEDDQLTWGEEPSETLIQRSQFNLFHDIGVFLFGRRSGQALQFATQIMARPEAKQTSTNPSALTGVRLQRVLPLCRSIEREWSYASR